MRRSARWAADTYPAASWPSSIKASSLAQASTMPLTNKDGTLVFVESVSDYFRIESGGSYTPDGVNILATSIGPDVFLERLYVHDTRWADQATWYIDPVGGSNDNAGDAPTRALRTHQELEARLDRPNQSITVRYLNQPAADDYVRIDFFSDRHSAAPFDSPILTYVGFRTPLLSSTFTAVTGPTRTALVPEATLISDAAIASFVPYTNKCIVVTSGAAVGAIAWIAKGVAANQARLSPFYYADPTSWDVAPLPAPGDSYQICSLMDLPVVTASTSQPIVFQNLRLQSGCDFYSGTVFIVGCDVDDTPLRGVIGLRGCHLFINGPGVQIYDGNSSMDGCLIEAGNYLYLNGAMFLEITRSIFQNKGTAPYAISLGYLDPAGIMAMTDVGFFDYAKVMELAGAASLNLNNGPFPIVGPSLWGSGVTTGVNANGNATIQHGSPGLPGNYPNFAPAGASSLQLNGVNKPWTDIPFFDNVTTGVRAVLR